MTKLGLSQTKPIPGFDSQKWLRKVRAQIHEETKDMTSAEVCEYFRKGSEELQADIRRRSAKLATENHVSEPQS